MQSQPSHPAVDPRPFPRDQRSLLRLRHVLGAHSPFVERSLRRFGVPESDLPDAAQDVFVVAARRLQDFGEDRERSFLYGTALRVASERARRARRHPERAVESVDPFAEAPSNAEVFTELRRAKVTLDRLLSRMSPGIRRVFELTVLEELSGPAVAKHLDIPLGTVRSRLQVARAKLANALA